MMRRMIRFLPAAALIGAVALMTSGISGQSNLPSTRNGDWPHYTGDARGTR